MTNTKKTILLLLLICTISSCGTNIFKGFVAEPEKSLLESIEDASKPEDYSRLITAADEIINSSSATDAEKAEAHLIKAEAILGKSNITPLDIMADLALSAEGNTNPINVLNTSASIDDLIAASTSLSAANDLGDSGNDEQNLIKGIVNTMIVMNTITEEFTINENGDIENDVSDYSASLENIMYPDPSNTDLTILDYTNEALEGFTNSGALTAEQLAETKTIKTQVEDIKTLNEEDNNETDIQDTLKTIFQGF
ncbi:hypothetical protein DID74_02675 [Candidatus Marinamargulisbacteria bacterium SCGC AG-333-B06]|nr:hypothetical protein DID74_02675 [Candidatus Marinamargulisbacteria bacterium SCGC AG-333-B06]